MKYPKQTGQILACLSTLKLTQTEFRVILNWIQDSKSFNPPASVIASRTGLRRDQVTKALLSLRKKQVLVDAGFSKPINGQATKIYDIHQNILTQTASSPQISISSSQVSSAPQSILPGQPQPFNTPAFPQNNLRRKSMDKFDKIIFTYKSQNPKWLDSKSIDELIKIISKEGIEEGRLNIEIEKLTVEAFNRIDRTNKTDDEKLKWKENINDYFNGSIATHMDRIDLNQHTKPCRSDMAAKKAGFQDAKQMRDYIDSHPILTQEMIKAREEKIRRSLEEDEKDKAD